MAGITDKQKILFTAFFESSDGKPLLEYLSKADTESLSEQEARALYSKFWQAFGGWLFKNGWTYSAAN